MSLPPNHRPVFQCYCYICFYFLWELKMSFVGGWYGWELVMFHQEESNPSLKYV